MSHLITSQPAEAARAAGAPANESGRPATGRGPADSAGTGREFNDVFAAQKQPPAPASDVYSAHKRDSKTYINHKDIDHKPGSLSIYDLAQTALPSSDASLAQRISVTTELPRNIALAGARAGPAGTRSVTADPQSPSGLQRPAIAAGGLNLPPDGSELPRLPAAAGNTMAGSAGLDSVLLQRGVTTDALTPASPESAGESAEQGSRSWEASRGGALHNAAAAETRAPLQRALHADQLLRSGGSDPAAAQGTASPQNSLFAPDSARHEAAQHWPRLPAMQSASIDAQAHTQHNSGNSEPTGAGGARRESPGMRVPLQYLSGGDGKQLHQMGTATGDADAGAFEFQVHSGGDTRAVQSLAGEISRRNDRRNTEAATPVTASPLSGPAGTLRSAGTETVAAQTFADASAPETAVSRQISSQLIAMRMDGQSVAKLQLHPAELGALEIRIAMQDEGAVVSINAQQQGTRDLIEASLPRLRELFESSGSQLLDVDVSGSDNGKSDNSASDQQRSDAPTQFEHSAAAQPQLPAAVHEQSGSSRLLDRWA